VSTLTTNIFGKDLQSSAPVGIRTPNLLIRSQMLYPVELRAQSYYLNLSTNYVHQIS
jgi:hypothetical protein